MTDGEGMPDCALGDLVTWTSQASGTMRTKTGRVVGVVPSAVSLWRYLRARADLTRVAYDWSPLGDGDARYEPSYLVAVDPPATTGRRRRPRPKLYWPRVCTLQHSTPALDTPASLPDDLAALHTDAARYRWLRDQACRVGVPMGDTSYWHLPVQTCPVPAGSWDAAVDAARGVNDADSL